MRRKDREMPEAFAWAIADQCQWATMAFVDPSGSPYSLPISIVREENHIFFHSAQSGFKIECLRNNPKVCLSCVGETFRPPDDFTTGFQSAILRGEAVEIIDEQEKIHALRLLCQRHTPHNMEHFDEAIARSLARTAIWRIDITSATGKQKKLK
ncbi:MAG: pyridoxamine 5'-phosphate oxidase family protein [Firmicutes bacterium]|jgi:hypothetical protein|nr:pyridoxamine 5'-phosphate oxidase family protein [Bacillota bacterium]